jgi:6-pyruvoyl-tetrahydropterin synthase
VPPRTLLPLLLVTATSCAAVAQPPLPPAPKPAAAAPAAPASAAASTARAPDAPAPLAIIRPAEIDDVLSNPGIGIQTFQRFDGQALNPNRDWSEVGPVEKIPDPPVKADFPPTTIAYCRWFWSQLEPEQGKVRWEILDQAIEQAHAHKQTLAIRLMPYDPGHPLPEWYRNSGARRANKDTDKDARIWQPDFGDPLYEKYWGGLVAAAGARYDGHPYLESVDISTVGYWGEGWSEYLPDMDRQKALIDLWFKAFPHTPLLMNFDEPDALAYGTGRGAGYRLDCLGDMRTGPHGEISWSHMWSKYPQGIAKPAIVDVWRKRPVVMETCWVPGYWKAHDWDIDAILAQALRWHLSALNIKSSAVPPEWKAKFDAFQKRMGYRLVLKQITYPSATRPGRTIPVHMWWLNAGVAPPYHAYDLALELRSPKKAVTIRIPADVRTFQPDDTMVDASVYVPEDLAPGAYRVRVALLDPRTQAPAVRLAIAGRQADGWYDLGALQVE